MKKLNNKGFSLVEILAAIAILAVLMMIATQAYNTYKKKARQQAYDTMAKSATVAVTNYLMENNKTKYITFETLKDMQYVDTLQDPRYKDKECSGIVINKVVQGETQKQLDVLFQKVKLCCKNYKYQYDYTGDEVKITKIENCEYIEGDEIDGVYKLIYKPQGGTSCDPGVVMKKQGEEWGPLCETTKGDSVFMGWNTKKNGSGSTITEHTLVEDKDINVYAIWNNYYTLTYSEEGGTPCNPQSIRRAEGQKWGILCTPQKTQYVFKGWNTKKDGSGTSITKNTYVENDLTVYAIWNPKYTITYNSNGGTACDPSSFTVEKGEKLGALCTPRKDGYIFSGWKDQDNKKVTKETVCTKDLNLTAQWDDACPAGYTYNSNGTCVKTYNATEFYVCPSGTVLSGTQCIKTTTTNANVSYSCPRGGNLSGTKCTLTTTYSADKSYTCPDGGSLSGTLCIKTTNTSATKSYTCPSGASLSGTTCTKETTYNASVSYTCPNGGSLSGSNCVSSSTQNASVSYSCPDGGELSGTECKVNSTYAATVTSYTNGCQWVKDGGLAKRDDSSIQDGAIWESEFTTECTPFNQGATQRVHDCGSGKKACWRKAKSRYDCDEKPNECYGDDYPVYSRKVLTCTCSGSKVYSCPDGGTLSNTTCTINVSKQATATYSCSSGYTLNGTSCTKNTSTAATATYSCNSGDTKSGTKCTSSTTSNATTNYNCPSGYELSGTTCTKTTSYEAATRYGCDSGDVASGSSCISTSTYTATTNYNCSSGYELSGTTCTTKTITNATKKYGCNDGDKLDGTTCTSIINIS